MLLLGLNIINFFFLFLKIKVEFIIVLLISILF